MKRSTVSWDVKRTTSNKKQLQQKYNFIQEHLSYRTVIPVLNPGTIDPLNINA